MNLPDTALEVAAKALYEGTFLPFALIQSGEDIFQETYEPAETRTAVLCGNSELDAEQVGRQIARAARRARRGGDAA